MPRAIEFTQEIAAERRDIPQGPVEIYILADATGIRYVGKANNAQKRLKSHYRDCMRRSTPVYLWLRGLLARGEQPRLEIWTRCSEAGWADIERRCIKIARDMGWPLLNVAIGGDQPHCSTATRAENGRKNAQARQDTPDKRKLWELKRNIGEALRKGKVKPEMLENIRAAAIKAPHLFGCFANV